MSSSQSRRAILYAIGAVLCWSTVATAFKIALASLSVYEMLLIACPTSMLIFAISVTFERKWKILASMSRREVALCALTGLVNPLAYYLVLFAAYDYLPAHVAQPVNYAWPILLVILLAVIHRKPVPVLKYVGMAVSLAGVTIIALGKGDDGMAISTYGLLLAATSALLWAVYWVINDSLKSRLDSSLMLFLGFAFGTIYLLIGALFIPLHIPSTDGLLAGMYIGAMEMGIPFILFSLALRYTDNTALVNQLCYLAPFLSLFLIAVVLHESVTLMTYLGLALIVGGLIFNQYFVKQKD